MILVEAAGDTEADCVVLLNDSVVPFSAFNAWLDMYSIVTASDGLEIHGFRSSAPILLGTAFEWDFSIHSGKNSQFVGSNAVFVIAMAASLCILPV